MRTSKRNAVYQPPYHLHTYGWDRKPTRLEAVNRTIPGSSHQESCPDKELWNTSSVDSYAKEMLVPLINHLWQVWTLVNCEQQKAEDAKLPLNLGHLNPDKQKKGERCWECWEMQHSTTSCLVQLRSSICSGNYPKQNSSPQSTRQEPHLMEPLVVPQHPACSRYSIIACQAGEWAPIK